MQAVASQVPLALQEPLREPQQAVEPRAPLALQEALREPPVRQEALRGPQVRQAAGLLGRHFSRFLLGGQQ